jgi:exopolysaccharide biosynthesis protein
MFSKLQTFAVKYLRTLLFLDVVFSNFSGYNIQSDQKVSVHPMITIQKVTSNFQSSPANFQGQGDTRLTLTLSVIPNFNYVIMVSELNCLNYCCVFFVL